MYVRTILKAERVDRRNNNNIVAAILEEQMGSLAVI